MVAATRGALSGVGIMSRTTLCRSAAGIVVSAAVALAAGCGAALASSTSSRMGTVAVTVAYLEPHFHGVVTVFNGAGQVIARHDVRNSGTPLVRSQRHFRFVLRPGRYEVKLGMKKRWAVAGCRYNRSARVQANDTTHVLLDENCAAFGSY